MNSNKKPGATKPQGIAEKFEESRFFLGRMAEHEKEGDVKNFLSCLSAFLSAFGSIRNRLLGVVDTLRGASAKRTLQDFLDADPKIGFLVKLRDVEVHRDGATVWPVYRLTDARINPPGPLELHFFPKTPNHVRVFGFRFEGHDPRENLIQFCRNALNDFEEILKRQLPVGP